MPELPDLQVFSMNLTQALKDKKLAGINVMVVKKLNVPTQQLARALKGQKLSSVERKGKQLYFKFANGQLLGLHLMLHGQLHWFEDSHNEHKHTIAELHFDDGRGLAITDFQKQATLTLNPEVTDVPDALEADYRFLHHKLKNSRSAVKTLLMDQHVIGGIGNAYADEILYHARLSPFSVSASIPDDKVKELAASIKKVLKDAQKQILEKDPQIISGEVRDFFKVHLPKQHTTPDGAAILQKTLSGRKTYYTAEQQLFD